MKQNRCIIINALPRSGSNILWNIVSSHPDVSMPRRETGEIVSSLRLANIVRSRLRDFPILGKIIGHLLKMRFHSLKVSSIQDNDHNESYPGQKYTVKELENTIVCLKSIGTDYLLNDFIASQYNTAHFIGLVRNGYAFCNGMERRGHEPSQVAKLYNQYVGFLQNQKTSCPNYMIVRFEDLVSEPFSIASQLYDFLHLNPKKLDKLRLKSKRVLSPNGDHTIRHNKHEGKHYWFDEHEIKQFLDKGVNDVQTEALSQKAKDIFTAYCGDKMEAFGYKIARSNT